MLCRALEVARSMRLKPKLLLLCCVPLGLWWSTSLYQNLLSQVVRWRPLFPVRRVQRARASQARTAAAAARPEPAPRQFHHCRALSWCAMYSCAFALVLTLARSSSWPLRRCLRAPSWPLTHPHVRTPSGSVDSWWLGTGPRHKRCFWRELTEVLKRPCRMWLKEHYTAEAIFRRGCMSRLWCHWSAKSSRCQF